MMEKLRIFFIEAWVWANQALYRSAVKAEGLIHFFGVQASVAQQFARKHEDGNLVPVARPRVGLPIDVDDIDGYPFSRRQSLKLAQHFLAQAAPGTGVQQESLGINDEESRRRWKFSQSAQ
jgi:hypothetical protein